MANTTTKHDLTQKSGRQALYKDLGRVLVRTDFPDGDAGWKLFCQHKVDKYSDRIAEATVELEKWKALLNGADERSADLVQQLAKAQADAKRLEAELAAMKKPEPKK